MRTESNSRVKPSTWQPGSDAPQAPSQGFYSHKPGRLYADVIKELDWSVGKVLARVKELKLEQNTIVLFMSDNGPWFGGSTGALRGMKARLWEGGIRVPMIAQWPERIPPRLSLEGNLRRDRYVPHALRAGRRPASNRPRDQRQGYRGPDGLTMIAPYEQARPNQYPGIQTGDAPKEMMLFDLEKYQAEQHDVAAANPVIVPRLRAMFDKMDSQTPAFEPIRPKWQGLKDIKGGDLKYEPREQKSNEDKATIN